MPLMLEGQVDPRDQQIQKLKDRVAELEGDLVVAKAQAQRAEQSAARAVGNLRRQLTPLYDGLRMLFGEMDAVTGQDGSGGGAAATSETTSKWDLIKKRNPGRIAEAIDVLLIHGAMNNSQLAAAMRMNRTNCSTNVVPKLSAMGLIERNGNMISLKQL